MHERVKGGEDMKRRREKREQKGISTSTRNDLNDVTGVRA